MTAGEVVTLAHRLAAELPCRPAPPGYAFSPLRSWGVLPTGDVCRWLYRKDLAVTQGQKLVVSVEDMLKHELDPAALATHAMTLQDSACFAVVIARIGVMPWRE